MNCAGDVTERPRVFQTIDALWCVACRCGDYFYFNSWSDAIGAATSPAWSPYA